jgi:hypothetical protein
MIKTAYSVETIGGQEVQVYYDLQNNITQVSVNLRNESEDVATLQVTKQGKTTLNFSGSANLVADAMTLQTAILTWLEEVETGKVTALKAI